MSFWPIVWLGVGVVAAVIEGLTVQLVAIWFALSAAVIALASAFGINFTTQLILFVLLSALLLVCTRPLVKKKLTVQKQSTNADQVLDKVGVVLTGIDNDLGVGRVSVMGLDWAARTKDGTKLSPGARVRVLSMEGVTLTVKQETME